MCRAEEFCNLRRGHADFDLPLDLPDNQPISFDFCCSATATAAITDKQSPSAISAIHEFFIRVSLLRDVSLEYDVMREGMRLPRLRIHFPEENT
jgi:hypothetical protein